MNMHQLGVSFVERVVDFRRRQDEARCKTVAPGESLEFLAQIRGWHSEDRKQRRARLLQLNNIGLRDELDQAAGTDVIFIPKEHFAKETLESKGRRISGIECCQSCGAGSAENVMSERRDLASHRLNGGESNLPRVLSSFENSKRDRHHGAQAED